MSNVNCLEDYASQWDNSYYDDIYERMMLHSFLCTLIMTHLKEYKPLWFHKTESSRYPGWETLQVFDSEEAYMKVRMAALRKYCVDRFRSHVCHIDPLYSFKKHVYRKKNIKSYDIRQFSERIENDIKDIENIINGMAECSEQSNSPYSFLEKIQNIKLSFALNSPEDPDPGRTTIWISNIPNEILTEKVSPHAEGEEQYHFLHDIKEVMSCILDSYEVVSEVHYTTHTTNDTTTYIADFNAFE